MPFQFRFNGIVPAFPLMPYVGVQRFPAYSGIQRFHSHPRTAFGRRICEKSVIFVRPNPKFRAKLAIIWGNGDGQCNLFDWNLEPFYCEGDFDSDEDVDGSDLAVFAADFGRTDCPN